MPSSFLTLWRILPCRSLPPKAGTANSFFVFAAILNMTAIAAWLGMNPKREVNKNLSPAQVRFRLILLLLILVGGAVGAVFYSVFLK